MTITPDNISAIMQVTFGYPLSHYVGLVKTRSNSHKESIKELYHLKCMAYYLYKHGFGATYKTVAELLGVSQRFVQNAVILIENENGLFD